MYPIPRMDLSADFKIWKSGDEIIQRDPPTHFPTFPKSN